MGHLNSRLIWHKYAERYFKEGLKILEIGPQGNPTYYEQALRQKLQDPDYSVLDISTDFISGGEQHPKFILAKEAEPYPIADNSFDIVFSDQVLAHVEFFWQWYGELQRITKPGGLIITINSYSYPSCPSPIDAWRVHSDGMKALNKFYGLETVESITSSEEMEYFGVSKQPGSYFAGASFENPYGPDDNKNRRINNFKKSWNKIVGRIPKLRPFLMNPVQVAFDTITIARKPLR